MAIPDGSSAVLIGVSRYRNTTAYPSYRAVGNSLRGLHGVLVDSGLCGWPSDRVEVIENPEGAAQLIMRLRVIAQRTTGILLLYFVGHGVLTDKGRLCLAIRDTDAENPDVTGIEYDRIADMLRNRTPAEARIVILDCCYSGRTIDGLGSPEASQLADASDITGAYILTAADNTAHVVPAAEQADTCTSFTGELIALTQAGVPGAGPDLTLSELFPELKHRLHRSGLPAPNQRISDTVGRFVFTRNASPGAGPVVGRASRPGAAASEASRPFGPLLLGAGIAALSIPSIVPIAQLLIDGPGDVPSSLSAYHYTSVGVLATVLQCFLGVCVGLYRSERSTRLDPIPIATGLAAVVAAFVPTAQPGHGQQLGAGVHAASEVFLLVGMGVLCLVTFTRGVSRRSPWVGRLVTLIRACGGVIILSVVLTLVYDVVDSSGISGFNPIFWAEESIFAAFGVACLIRRVADRRLPPPV